METFEITSGVMVLSDPCYDRGWGCSVVEGVAKGVWGVVTTPYLNRIKSLYVHHHRFNKEFSECNIDLDLLAPVDSGQFGFFDSEHYRNDESAKNLPKQDFGLNWDQGDEGEQWYKACCYLTLNDAQYGTLPFGVVSSSGFGDGVYNVYGVKENGEYVAFFIEFIEESLDDEDDYEESLDFEIKDDE